MRVIEQLVQHFWARGAITRDEALYLVKHGFVREGDLPGLVEGEQSPDSSAAPSMSKRELGDHWRALEDEQARQVEQLEDELTGRNAGSKKRGGKKPKPSGHNLAPAAAVLAGHFADREPYPALREL